MTERKFGLDSLPIRSDLTLEPIRPIHSTEASELWELENEFTNGYLTDENNHRIAVIRDYIAYRNANTIQSDLADGLRELNHLESMDIGVANRQPFIGPDYMPYLLVEYIDGTPLHHASSDYRSQCLDLIKKLEAYYVEGISAGRSVLADISSSFQYVVRNGEIILVDLDMHLFDGTNDPIEQSLIADNILEEFSEGSGFFPTEKIDCSIVMPTLCALGRSNQSPRGNLSSIIE
jgi:hypothetical protein